MDYFGSLNVVLFIILCTFLVLLLVFFIGFIVFRYQQRQKAYFKNLEEIRITHENILLQSQVEMQEMTFQNISREIHDNIGQKLALAKLLLNTLPYDAIEKLSSQVESSVDILGQVVNELSNISRSMSNEIVLENGIIRATEAELKQIKKSALYKIDFKVTGETVFMDVNREVVLFRVIQESLHNIIKHAKAQVISVEMQFGESSLALEITDDGLGFFPENSSTTGTGIKNIRKRVQLLNGTYRIESIINKGTIIKIEIPFL